jgi:hypothetical protein
MARMTGFEPAASGVTGRRSKPLSYTRARIGIMTPREPALQPLGQGLDARRAVQQEPIHA